MIAHGVSTRFAALNSRYVARDRVQHRVAHPVQEDPVLEGEQLRDVVAEGEGAAERETERAEDIGVRLLACTANQTSGTRKYASVIHRITVRIGAFFLLRSTRRRGRRRPAPPEFSRRRAGRSVAVAPAVSKGAGE
ncbi:hypothetical protein ACPEEZ_12230 [Frigoribacterium sp. 2-23]|uniref:hypothetical protein n=1 Tax=Frigoribacterium sp. 2-23 TaxID=3415006 RepID=UPI003C6F9FB9